LSHPFCRGVIYRINQKTGIQAWEPIYLKTAAGLHDIQFGVVIDGSENLNNIDPELFDQNFNAVTMTWSSSDKPFEDMGKEMDHRLTEIADKKLQEITWFHLGDIPLQAQSFQTKEEAIKFANDEIDKTVQKYGSHITTANIFNEVNNQKDNAVYRLWQKFGDEFIIAVYKHVRNVLPDRKILVNNSFNYSKTIEGSTYQDTLKYANLLKSQGLIDAVGMEMHQAQSPWGVEHPLVINDAVEVMRSFGLPVYVTELDVNQTYMTGMDQEKLIKQAQLYEDVIRACVRSQVCERICLWSSTDQSSWYEFAVGEKNAHAGIFENDGTPKLAYYAILRGFLEGYLPIPK
jgi:endo-1,4-beta-xylanase